MAEYLQTIISDAYILAYTTANPTQFPVSTTISSVEFPTRNITAYDLKLKHDCDHVLDGIQYTLGTCPRCLGNGYYYDIKIDNDGRVMQISGVDKLTQELEKIVLSGNNPFHPEYGVYLSKYVGEVPIDDLKAVIKKDLIAAINLLSSLQEGQSSQLTFSPKEKIFKIERIDIEELENTGLQFQVIVITVNAKKLSFEGIVPIL